MGHRLEGGYHSAMGARSMPVSYWCCSYITFDVIVAAYCIGKALASASVPFGTAPIIGNNGRLFTLGLAYEIVDNYCITKP